MDILANIGIFIGVVLAVVGGFYGLYRAVDVWVLPLILRRPRGGTSLKAIAEEVAAKAEGLIRSQVKDYNDGFPQALDRKRAELYLEGLRLKGERYFESAIGSFQKALEQPGTDGEKVALLSLLGNCYLSLVDLAPAEAHYRQAQALATSINDKEGQAVAGGNLEVVKQLKEELERAFVALPDLGIKQRIEIAGLFMDGLKARLGVRR